ncbi:hypothetical protein C5167_018298 [Papaver somniferum]|uniref:TNFR-Cys domain-containing protein n=1 Tax=Papaver somniferum TaxID=3469 RepID=A0A4Y7ILW3_PAPSO|nr:hypothetical protein C5167_018298 [Papaver somniferum]
MMASCSSSPIFLCVFAMLALSAYSEMANDLIYKCPRQEDSYDWAEGTNCSSCANNCASKCLSLNKGATQLSCNDYPRIMNAVCNCCCTPHTPPPPPPSPSPSPLPPTPAGDNCNKPGDAYSETTFTTLDCSYCKNWCQEDCLGKVVSNKCSMGESLFVTRCKCCCNETPELEVNVVKEIVRLNAH